MTKYALINEENVVIDLLEVENTDSLDGYILPAHQCALVNITNSETPSIGQVWNPYTNKFE